MNKYHPYHLAEQRPWPIIGRIGAFSITTGRVLYFHFSYRPLLILGFTIMIIIMITWWRDITRESSFQGHHTIKVQTRLKYGMILFISSEILFFFSFFWAFFHSRLVPIIEIGAIWPPEGINPLNPIAIPLLNTLVLLRSWNHYNMISPLNNLLEIKTKE